MVVVIKQKGESDDKLIGRFKRVMFESGKLELAKEKGRFVSDSEKRQEKRKAAKHRQKLERKRNQ